ncbi:hypothetical protein HRR83_004071 [Exophiala dermatitidis]|nr:hypothetical protein HRR73_007714 [Exophiala dermatitidis]KAJ4531798.1 hypothetical protein HRR77_009207 [Exophiala dermatitidis]KAJ4537362.1 hypothetical protein HRR76_005372 [Exophiala dermatitidis]KAJ4597927.1 hypothetical protein HRR83_004071 [Exophiala dermatitidis]KAJ4600583.1 hypothetical protein HRR85_009290 [Exophiala dermatitidis]
MPEIITGSGSVDDPFPPSLHVSTPLSPNRNVVPPDSFPSPSGLDHIRFQPTINDAAEPSSFPPHADHHPAERCDVMHDAEAEAYYDSRAATKKEFRRRASTLQEYYKQNPHLLPQLPFTWHRGVRRFRLAAIVAAMGIDACIVPIALYYGLYYGGDVQNWITFAVVTTVWGGPTYLEFAIRTLRLVKKESFYRPLGTNSRWCFDVVTWVSMVSITAVTALFIVGSAPHIVWLRVLCMPAPSLLYSLGGVLGLLTFCNGHHWKAPFRLSSTGRGEPVKPGVYYFIEDVVAVNANAGRPYREALAARYDASPRFRQMMYTQSLFWSIPALIIAIPLTVIAVVHSIPATVAYGICAYHVSQNGTKS